MSKTLEELCTSVEELFETISKYSKIEITPMPSGLMTGHAFYNNRRPRSICEFRDGEENVIRSIHRMIKRDMYQECLQVEKFKTPR